MAVPAWGQPLRGLEPPGVTAAEVPAALARRGLTEEALARAVREEMEAAGIRPGTGAGPGLVARVWATELRGAGMFACAVELALEEEVGLARGGASRAATWRRAAVLAQMSGRAPDAVLRTVRDLARTFANEYRAENPER